MSANPNVVPPATKTKTDAPKTVTPPGVKAEKVGKPPKVIDPNAPKKERAPRKDVGIVKDGTIVVTEKLAEAKFRGKRAEYRELLQKFNGKKVSEFYEAGKAKDTGKGGSAASWMRWFVVEGYATVTPPATPAVAPPVKA